MKRKKYIINPELFEAVLEKTLNESYPLGADNDPAAPYNQPDEEFYREVNLKPSEITFENIVSNDEFAIVRQKATQDYYILYLDPTDPDFQQFIAAPTSSDGTDEDGLPITTNHYDHAAIDDKAIESYASYLELGNHYGVGVEAYDKGLMAQIDNELRSELITTFDKFKQYGKNQHYDAFIDVLNNI